MSELNEFNSVPTPPPALASIQLPSPPLPPLLPPSHPSLQSFKQKSQASEISEISKVPENELDKSLNMILSYEANFNKVFFSSYTFIEPQLQDGPKCGLVALSIATSSTQNFVSVDKIFQAAVSFGFTMQGEMFSADSLALLAEKCCGFKSRVLKGNLYSHFHCVIKSLLKKCLLLVPYDADFNHSPCCKRGLRAHWAVISGFVIIEDATPENHDEDDHSVVFSTSKSSSLCDCPTGSNHLPLIVSVDRGRVQIAKRAARKDARVEGEPTRGKVYLIGRQGKSRHLGLWPFDDMADSNDNLVSVSDSRSRELYKLPEDGIAEGLKGKAIILERPVKS